MTDQVVCPDCEKRGLKQFSRRQFVHTAGAAAVATLPYGTHADNLSASKPAKSKPEALVKKLYQSLVPAQQDEICFPWDHSDDRGLLRTHVSNNWNITDTKFNVGGKFFTADQRDLVEAVFLQLYNPEWHDRIRKQLKDDAGGYGKKQTIAIFGKPDTGKFEFVMTGRHLTIRCDGDSSEHVAFGGPIFYGHAAQGFNEKPNHPGNVFWEQALKANALFRMLDGRQRQLALVPQSPSEGAVAFQGKQGKFPGIPISELAADQKAHVQKILKLLIEPYRQSDQAEALRCLSAQGGLDKCSVAFYQSDDIGNDQVWDMWRLEGPSFVWYFRGSPHVHVWVNVADSPTVKLNAIG